MQFSIFLPLFTSALTQPQPFPISSARTKESVCFSITLYVHALSLPAHQAFAVSFWTSDVHHDFSSHFLTAQLFTLAPGQAV